jgi:hypothetical protein
MEEPVQLGSDRMSLETSQPVASSNAVRLLVNNEVYVPNTGLYSPARLTGGASGPFNISTEANELTVQNQSESVTVTLPLGFRVETDRIVRIFLGLLNTILVENDNGHLVFTDTVSVGSTSRIRVTGTAAETLGFGGQQAARGRQLYPAWQLASRPDTIRNLFPRFVSPVKTNPHFKATYVAPVERCLRCGATFIENDFRYDLLGDPILIDNENLLYQAALKILLTDKGSNPYHLWYGTTLQSRIGLKALSATAMLINEDVRRALDNMKKLQTAQAKYQSVSFRERLVNVLAVNVFPHETDQTAFLVDVVVSNASGEPVQLSIVFSVPGVVALMGSNGLSLGLETTGLTPEQSRLFGLPSTRIG